MSSGGIGDRGGEGRNSMSKFFYWSPRGDHKLLGYQNAFSGGEIDIPDIVGACGVGGNYSGVRGGCLQAL